MRVNNSISDQVEDLLELLPAELMKDEISEMPLHLFIERFDSSWSAFYSDEDDAGIINGTLCGSGLTMLEALQDLYQAFKTEYPKWLANQTADE